MFETTVIFLAGGYAPRMRPLSLSKPKSMISFMGKPLLSYLIASLKLSGLPNIIICTSYEQVEAEKYFSSGEKLGANIKYYESKWYGTAGTTKHLVNKFGDEISDPFMVIYGDSLLKANYQEMIEFHKIKNSCVTILDHCPNFESFLYEYQGKDIDSERRTNYGVMDIDSGNRIIKIIEKPQVSEIKNIFSNPVANAAVYVLNKKILDFVPSNEPFDFPRNLFPLLVEKGKPCFAFDIGKGYRVDIGTIPNYYNTQIAILEGRIDFDICFPLLREGIWVGVGSIIDSMAKLDKPVLICENSNIGLNANVEWSIIGNKVHIGEHSSIRRSIILDNVIIGNKAKISWSIIGENCIVGNGVSLPKGTILGNYCSVGGSQIIMKD